MLHIVIVIEVNGMPPQPDQQPADPQQANLQQANLQQNIDFMNYSRSIYEIRQTLLKKQEKEHNMLEYNGKETEKHR